MRHILMLATCTISLTTALHAQSLPTTDPVLRQIWDEGMQRSQADLLAQTLLDSLGPRLTGSPDFTAASAWAIGMFRAWGVPARAEPYGTWPRWTRGLSHIDLVAPRERSLEGGALAWSIGTGGKTLEGDVVVLPDVPDSTAFAQWLGTIKGKYVAVSFPQPTCRPDPEWEEYAGGEDSPMARMFGRGPVRTAFHRMRAARAAADSAWKARVAATGLSADALREAVAAAGAAGLLTSDWAQGYGVTRIFDARTDKAPVYWLSCEDYGLVARLAERHQGPRVRAMSTAAFTGEGPTVNTIAELRGSDRPDEYVVLSAHFDSWDGASGATDNGTGSVIMMEAMRILSTVYPQPKRTILVGLWNSEEQGLNGSQAFATDHPAVVTGLQALFNQDNGTGRVESISASGLVGAGEALGRWFSRLPGELTRGVRLDLPGSPEFSGSDHAAFSCAGVPAFDLQTEFWDYFTYTWHTNRDTYDKIVMENVRSTATMVAMLAYLASEDPAMVTRERRVMGVSRRSGQPGAWPACQDGARSFRPGLR